MTSLKRLLKTEYGLKVLEIEKHPGGFQNEIYFINTPKGEYTLRVYRISMINRADLSFQFDVLDFLGDHGLPVQRPINNIKGEKYTIFKDKQICQLLTYLEGKSAFPITSLRIKNSGILLGKIHQYGINYSYQGYSKSLIQRRTWKKIYFENKISSSFKIAKQIPKKWYKRAKLSEVVCSLLDAKKRFNIIAKSGFKYWDKGLIHGDFNPGNLIFESSRITGLFDFDQCGYGPIVWDVAFALAHYGFHLHHTPHEDIRKYFLSGYRKYFDLKVNNQELRIVTAFAMAERLSASVLHFKDYPSKRFWQGEVTYYHHKLCELLK